MDVVLKMQLNVLIHLAMVDGEISKEEKKTLEAIASKHNVSPFQLEEMIQYPKPIESLGALSNDVKFEYLYSIVDLMNIDDEIDQREIHFCQNMAVRLGYYKEVIDELWSEILENKDLRKNKEEIKKKIQKFNPYIWVLDTSSDGTGSNYLLFKQHFFELFKGVFWVDPAT